MSKEGSMTTLIINQNSEGDCISVVADASLSHKIQLLQSLRWHSAFAHKNPFAEL